MTHLNSNRTFLKLGSIVGTFILLTFLLFLVNKVNAQSFKFDPASPVVTSGGSVSFDLVASNPPAEKTAAVRITFPSNIQVTGFTQAAGALALKGQGCDSMFTGSTLCFDYSKLDGINFSDGEPLGTITITGLSDGSAAVTFGAGTMYLNGSDITGNVGTVTVGTAASGGGGTTTATGGSGGSNLPQTSVNISQISILMLLGMSAFVLAALTIAVKPTYVLNWAIFYKDNKFISSVLRSTEKKTEE
ncbi:MAG: hypothetical protein Q9M91_08970 [Candidatus Dojkabacteria bacterium]|nr:hypothetical protein [Candidatus Dojkabacteria bacterium]MDQ7021904.1 hypothetical protein [Candidatus Dojkabacteria bacterium]